MKYKMNLVAKAKKHLPIPIIDTLRPFYWRMYRSGRYLEEMEATGHIPQNGAFARICIETIAYCNRKCPWCPNNDRFPDRERGIMSIDVFKKIIEELSSIDFAGKIELHHFGEPLMDKRLPDLISFTREKCPQAKIVFFSNGDLLTEELLSKLLENGLDSILVTNYDDFEKPNLIELSEEYPAHINYKNFKMIKARNCAGIVFNRRNPYRCTPCFHPSTIMVVNWKGNVVLCVDDYYEKHIFGNVQTESLLDIWNSAEYNKYKVILKRGQRHKVDICRNCDEFQI